MSTVVDQPIFVLIAAVSGLAVALLVLGQPLGRPRPDLLVRVRELDPRSWPDRLEVGQQLGSTSWLGVPLVDALLRPVIEVSAAQISRLLALAGLADPR